MRRFRDLRCRKRGWRGRIRCELRNPDLIGAQTLHWGWRAESGEPVQVGELIQVEAEEIGGILIFDRLVHQMSETWYSMADHYFGEQPRLKRGCYQRDKLIPHPARFQPHAGRAPAI